MAVQRARDLRKNATVAERILWTKLREFKHHGLHFRRQAPIGNYVVDFVCYGAKIIIEVDGSQHDEPDIRQYDSARTAFLNSQGYNVLRYWNSDVMRNSSGIADAIYEITKSNVPTRTDS